MKENWEEVEVSVEDADRKGNSMIGGFGIRGTRHNERIVEDFFDWCEDQNGTPKLDHDEFTCTFGNTEVKISGRKLEIEDSLESMNVNRLTGYSRSGNTFAFHQGYKKTEITRR